MIAAIEQPLFVLVQMEQLFLLFSHANFVNLIMNNLQGSWFSHPEESMFMWLSREGGDTFTNPGTSLGWKRTPSLVIFVYNNVSSLIAFLFSFILYNVAFFFFLPSYVHIFFHLNLHFISLKKFFHNLLYNKTWYSITYIWWICGIYMM